MITFEGFTQIEGGVCAAKGFKAAGIYCGIRKNKTKRDLALIYSNVVCDAAAVYTQNKVVGAPILVTKKNMQCKKAQALIANSGNANTCNADGEEKAVMMVESCAEALGINPQHVMVASTGVIGQPLPIEPITENMNALVKELAIKGSGNAAEAIMTTDLVKKEIAIEFMIGNTPCRIGGIAKGSGMIHPNMATMLCFLTTDIAIEADLLQVALKKITDTTFNMVSVDGDTSTNDMVSLMASGVAGNKKIITQGDEYELFCNALYVILMNLSRAIAGDGEGATKLLECVVDGCADELVARKIAKSIITSSLFKAAMFGRDANWGRILCAIGYTDAEFNINKVDVTLASTCGAVAVCKSGAGLAFDEELALKVLSADEIKILVNLNDGEEQAIAWGCDLTYDYVKINGDYRS